MCGCWFLACEQAPKYVPVTPDDGATNRLGPRTASSSSLSGLEDQGETTVTVVTNPDGSTTTTTTVVTTTTRASPA